MHRKGVIPRVWGFVRNYAIPMALLGVFIQTVVQSYITGIAPVPQEPPMGYVLGRNETKLEWHRSTVEGAWELQVSMDDPEFKDPFVTREVTGTSHMLNNLEPGHTFYWRLIRGDDSSSIDYFKTSKDAIAF
jgi:hypothetical protein